MCVCIWARTETKRVCNTLAGYASWTGGVTYPVTYLLHTPLHRVCNRRGLVHPVLLLMLLLLLLLLLLPAVVVVVAVVAAPLSPHPGRYIPVLHILVTYPITYIVTYPCYIPCYIPVAKKKALHTCYIPLLRVTFPLWGFPSRPT